MSAHSHATSETTFLLGDARPPSQSSRSLLEERSRFSPETLLIPVALATRLATVIPLTTFIDFVRRAICRLWNISHGNPAILSAGDAIIPDLCDAPEIARYFAIAMAIIAAMEGVISMIECGILSHISSHYGRKPAFLFLLIAGIMGNCLIPASEFVPDWLADLVLLVGVLFQLSSSSLSYTYLVNMYTVDVCIPEDRTAALSKIGGWAALGNCISFALGGSITMKTGNPLIVFYMAVTIFVATFVYVVSILPESFPEEKRNELSHMHAEPSIDGPSETTHLAAFLLVFEPLKMFMPTRKLNGTRNWRLTWCGAHTFMFMVANGYASTAWLVLATSSYHLTPEDTGFFLTIATVSGTITLMLIVPLLVRFLRPYYNRQVTRSSSAEENVSNGQELEFETSDHLDVHLAFLSCVIAAIFFLSAAAFTTNEALIFSGISIGFAYIHAPTIRSLVAGSVDPLKQGEAMAAIEMVNNAANFLSPIIMGSILTATISTAPLFLFYVHLVVVLTSGALLFLVRDTDRYQKLHEA